MPKTDKRIDLYILKSDVFAQEILIHLRSIVHFACPDAEETLKWNSPSFMYKGQILCGMASFKKHCAFGFWNAEVMKDPHGILERLERSGMGNLGRIETLKDLPKDKILISYIKEAVQLIDEGKYSRKQSVAEKTELIMHHEFAEALKKNKKADLFFAGLSYSKKKDYIVWVNEAKQDATRKSRIQTSVEWLSEGKSRNWKYEKPSSQA